MNDFSFIKSVDSLRVGIVVTVPTLPTGGLDPSFGQALSIFYRDVLAAAVAVMNKTSATLQPALLQSLLKGVDHKIGVGCAAHAPVDQAT